MNAINAHVNFRQKEHFSFSVGLMQNKHVLSIINITEKDLI